MCVGVGEEVLFEFMHQGKNKTKQNSRTEIYHVVCVCECVGEKEKDFHSGLWESGFKIILVAPQSLAICFLNLAPGH